MIHTIGWLCGISGSLTTLLFLFRVNGVYHNSTPAKCYFTCMWVVTTVGHLVFPLSLSSRPVQLDALCVVDHIKRYGVTSVFIVAIFDWTVFCCISLRVVQTYAPETWWWPKCKIFFTGAVTSTISRDILRTGHLYILYVDYVNCFLFNLQPYTHSSTLGLSSVFTHAFCGSSSRPSLSLCQRINIKQQLFLRLFSL